MCTAADGKAYANFLSKQLHTAGFTVTVDLASWSPFFDFDAVAATAVDSLLTMDTYDSKWAGFVAGPPPSRCCALLLLLLLLLANASSLNVTLQTVLLGVHTLMDATKNNMNRAGFGLCTDTDSGCGASLHTNISAQLGYLQSVGAKHIDIWDLPIPDAWYDLF